ncbi:hypothetical protein GCM10022392_13570 [Mucilaginibacter panaciglaebae]|uniref:DNA-binding protein n=2 Tax=Mucilaginibacter panaciglaebae TaxID=502331 RepID=A0ABP7WMX6_9SPHI
MVCIFQAAYAQTRIEAKEAPRHIKDTVTACGKVYSTKVIQSTGMVLLNIGGYYPNQDLTVVIKAAVVKQFKTPPNIEFSNGQVCITGAITIFKGKPEIIITNSQQIKKAS